MQTSPYEIAVIAGGFTIIGALLGAWIGYRNAIRLNSIVEFNKAATLFRGSFLPVLIFLKHNANIGSIGSSNRLGDILFHGYVHHHLKAFEVFRNYLSSKERLNIDQEWKKYCHHPENLENLCFEQYNEKNMEKTALERIEEILKIAEPIK